MIFIRLPTKSDVARTNRDFCVAITKEMIDSQIVFIFLIKVGSILRPLNYGHNMLPLVYSATNPT